MGWGRHVRLDGLKTLKPRLGGVPEGSRDPKGQEDSEGSVEVLRD